MTTISTPTVKVKVIRSLDARYFESNLQSALNDGFNILSSSAFAVENIASYVAVLVKETEQ